MLGYLNEYIKRRNKYHNGLANLQQKNIPLELEVMNSNPTYNILSESKPFLTDIDIINEHDGKGLLCLNKVLIL